MTGWIRPRPAPVEYRRDIALGLVVAAGATVTFLANTVLGLKSGAEPWVSGAAIALGTLPLVVRRRHPELVAIVLSVVFLVVSFALPIESAATSIPLMIALFTLGAWGRNRRRAIILQLILIGIQFLAFGVGIWIGSVAPLAALTLLIYNVMIFGAVFFSSSLAWSQAKGRAELEARTAQLEAQREVTASQAVAIDRMQIARELHDVVAHHVSVIGLQAGAARRVLLTDPEQASRSLQTIETSARETVQDLHQLLTTLRVGPADSPTGASSTLGLDQLPDLVEEAVVSGVPATMTVVGARRKPPSLVGFTLYRVAQEALTNVRIHAGAQASADVELRYLDDAIELEVTDSGVGARSVGHGSGLGLVGVRERVQAIGGRVDAGPREQGGFRVRATVPDPRSAG